MTLEGTTSNYNGNNHNGKAGKKNAGKVEFVQRYANGEVLAEAIIIGNKPYFAVIISGQFGNLGGVSIILHESISLDTKSDGLIKPPDAM
jgi:hypothetical protein